MQASFSTLLPVCVCVCVCVCVAGWDWGAVQGLLAQRIRYIFFDSIFAIVRNHLCLFTFRS